MKIQITEGELGNLKKESDGTYSYYIVTENGTLRGEGFPGTDEAIKHAQREMIRVVRAMLKKK